MFWNVFWYLFCLCFAAALGLAGWLTGPGKRKKWKRCTAHTQGTVLRAAALNYGGIHVPLVEYYVDGTAYRIAGPRFRGASVREITTPEQTETTVQTNLKSKETLPPKLRVKITHGPVRSVESPLMQLYPVGSFVEIYYDPQKPKRAFVQRFEGCVWWLSVLLFVLAVLCIALAFAMVIAKPFPAVAL